MASRSLGTLTLDLIARIGGFQQNMDRASQSVTRTGAAADAAAARVSALQSQFLSLSGVVSSLAGPLAAAFSLSAIYSASEAYTQLTSRLKLVTESSAELATAQNAVFTIAQSSFQPLSATAELYQRIATNQKELKLTGEGVAGVVGTISKTLAISGASAASADAALVQLGQAFASGVLRGEELNSVMEQAPALAQAIAAGMGKTVGELRALGAEGKLTADAVVKALQAQEQSVSDLFSKTAVTIGNSITATNNSLTQFIGRMDQAGGVSAAISANIVKFSKSIDGLTKDFATTSKTFEQISNAAETLAYIIGTRLVLSTGQAAIGFAAATKASIQQAGALVYSAAATWKSVEADAATARQTLATTQARQADAKALLERANLEVLSAEQKVASDRVRQQSEINNLKSVQATLVAERVLEEQRLAAQITEQGRAAARNRMALARLDEVAIIRQIQAAEAGLAATSTATSADIQAGYALRSAAAAGYAETTLAANAAVKASERAAAAATITSRSVGAVATAGSGLLGLLSGPVGLIAMTALVAASFIDFGGSADKASKSLIDHNSTIDQSILKYKELSAEQQRYQVDSWEKGRKEALSAAASDLIEYSIATRRALNYVAEGGAEYQKQFNRMLEEVSSGARSLDSVTEWAKETAQLNPAVIKQLTAVSAAYSLNSKEAETYSSKLDGVDASSRAATASAKGLADVQALTGGQTKGQIADWEKYVAKLIESRDLFGANAEAQAAYAADQMGLTAQQREQAKVISQQKDVLEKYRDALKENDKVQQEALKKQLIGLYTAEQAAEDAAAAAKRAHNESAKAATDSATTQISEMRRVIDAASNISKSASFLTGRNILLAPEPQADVKGRSMVLPGAETPATGVDPRRDALARANAALARISETTDPNKSQKKYQEDASQKVLDQARQQYAVLKEQSSLLDSQKGDIDKIGAATRELIKWEQELSDLKSKKTLTAEQKTLLAKQESITADLKRNSLLEKEIELRKIATEETKKFAAFQASVSESNLSVQEGFSQQLAGAGQGDKRRAQLQEMLAIEEDFNKQQRELVLQRNSGDISQALYEKETNTLSEALASRLVIQQDHYNQIDKAQSNWADGASDALQNYVDQAADVAAQTKELFSSAFSGLEDGIVQFVKTGKLSFKDMADSIVEDLIRIQVRQAAAGFLSSAFSAFTGAGASSGTMTGFSEGAMVANAKGGVYDSPSLSAYSGGVFDSPQLFAFAKGAGVFGEAGPEAIMPLTRAADGSLGVRALGGADTTRAEAAANSVTSIGGITQHISVQGSADDATLARIQQAAKQGAQEGYNMVLRDLKMNGPARQLIARNR